MHPISFFLDNRVRGRVCTFFRGKFQTLEAAEEAYNLSLSGCLEELTLERRSRQTSKRPSEQTTGAATGNDNLPLNNNVPADLKTAMYKSLENNVSTLPQFIEKLISLTDATALNAIANLCFMQLVVHAGIDSNPADYISRSLTAMKALKDWGKENLLYKFAFCLAEKFPGTERPILEMDRMPFGLIEYQLLFFSCTNMMQVCPFFFFVCLI